MCMEKEKYLVSPTEFFPNRLALAGKTSELLGSFYIWVKVQICCSLVSSTVLFQLKPSVMLMSCVSRLRSLVLVLSSHTT